jgi:hypothetical protein
LTGGGILMKKIATLVMTALIVSSLSGCTYRNTSYRNPNNGIYNGANQGTAQGTRTGYGITNQGTTQGIYRDGIYTGQGDRGANGNQTATVTISGGRIRNIVLGTDTTGTTTGITGRTTAIPGGTTGTNGTTGGAIAGGNAGNMTGRQRGNDGYITGDYSFQGIGGDAGGMMGGTVDGTGTAGGANTGWTTGGTGTTGGVGTTNNDTIKTQLANAMISQQTSEVSLGASDNSTTWNWKLAVRRALNNARTTGGTGTGGGLTR